ncbi:MAG: hypothetical protein A2016_01370 [Elusimicrobia bacterium GWF2_62_30]|nr:MAG: hypothetical protein A2016_01370 [Elusimicrobia bacterium GWF2_62_30]
MAGMEGIVVAGAKGVIVTGAVRVVRGVVRRIVRRMHDRGVHRVSAGVVMAGVIVVAGIVSVAGGIRGRSIVAVIAAMPGIMLIPVERLAGVHAGLLEVSGGTS